MAVGSYDETSGLLGALVPSSIAVHRKCHVTYGGVFQGQSLQGKFVKKRDAEAHSLLESVDQSTSFLMIVNDDGTELRFMDKPASKLHRFFTMKRLGTS